MRSPEAEHLEVATDGARLSPSGRLRHATGVRLFPSAAVRVTRGHKVIAGNFEARHDPTIADQRRRVRRTAPAGVADG
jgi:hypothetical protein